MFDLPGLTPLFTLVSTVLHAVLVVMVGIGLWLQLKLIKGYIDHESRISHLEGNKKENGTV